MKIDESKIIFEEQQEDPVGLMKIVPAFRHRAVYDNENDEWVYGGFGKDKSTAIGNMKKAIRGEESQFSYKYNRKDMHNYLVNKITESLAEN